MLKSSQSLKNAHMAEHSHKHQHKSQENGPRPHPLTQFFGCCLGDEPTPISPKIQSLRESLGSKQTEEIDLQKVEHLEVTSDMIIGDIIFNFPQTRPYLEDLHPLGLLSPRLDQTTIEMFFSDLNPNLEDICKKLTTIISVKPSI